MSGGGSQYVQWTPNLSFVKFFEEMSKRRIPATQAATMKVTDTSPPKSSQQFSFPKPQNHTGSSASDTLVRTAEAEMRSEKRKSCKPYKKRRKCNRTNKRTKDEKKSTSLEKKIKKHRF